MTNRINSFSSRPSYSIPEQMARMRRSLSCLQGRIERLEAKNSHLPASSSANDLSSEVAASTRSSMLLPAVSAAALASVAALAVVKYHHTFC